MIIADLAALLRSANLNGTEFQLKLRTLQTDNWLVDRVVIMLHEVEIEGVPRTEMLVFPDSVERNLPGYQVSEIVKMAMDTYKYDHGLVIHVVPNTIVTIRGDSFERTVKLPRQPFVSHRMHLDNPYLLDFLKGIRDADGALNQAA